VARAADFAWMAALCELSLSAANQFRKMSEHSVVNRMTIAPIAAFQCCSDVYVTEDVTYSGGTSREAPASVSGSVIYLTTATRMVLLSFCLSILPASVTMVKAGPV